MSEKKTIDLKVFEAAASRLAGRPVTVRSRHPVVSAYDGEAYRKDLEGIIDISPQLNEQQDILYVLTHEAAHLALHFWEVGQNWDKPESHYNQKWAYELTYKVNPDTIRMEKEADDLARIWITYAEQHYKDFGSDDMTRIERQLICLSHYIDPHLQEIIDKAVERAVRLALEKQSNRE